MGKTLPQLKSVSAEIFQMSTPWRIPLSQPPLKTFVFFLKHGCTPNSLHFVLERKKKQVLQMVWALMHSPSPVPGRAQFGRWMAPSTRFSDHGSTDGCIETQILVGWNDGSEWKIHRWEWDHIILQLGYLKSKLQNMHNSFDVEAWHFFWH